MLRPLNNQVVLRKDEVENKTSSGIIIATENKKSPCIGIVLATNTDNKINLKVNDKVVYKEYAGSNVTIDNKDYIIIDEKDILAVIE